MKPFRFFLFVLTTALTSSCVQYQFMSVSSNLSKNSQSAFSHENDTCAVSYNFSGKNCPLTLNIQNKLSEPLYVDWQKSSVTIFRDKMSLWNESSGEINAEPVSKILPKSSVEITPFNLITKFVELTPSDSFSHVSLMTPHGAVKMKKYVFDTITTPLHFKCKLHYSNFRSATAEQSFEDQFWVSSLISTTSSLPYKQPEIFYLQKQTQMGSLTGCLLLTGVLLLSASLSDEVE